MNLIRIFTSLIFFAIAFGRANLLFAQTPDESATMPRFQTATNVTQLVVDGSPFLILGGELGNSTAEGIDSLKTIWPTLNALHLNTVLAPVYWERMEPVEGKSDFTLLDALIEQSRQHDLHLVLLWFGAWKNSMSTYVPAWVKQDSQRFPRAQDSHDEKLDILSPFGPATLEADRKAFSALMAHLRDVDSKDHTVLMVQVENEIGMLPDARDFSPLANATLAEAVPQALLDCITKSQSTTSTAVSCWHKQGSPTSGNWTQVFGSDPAGAEVFTAWYYASFIDALVQAGKAQYPLPMYVNCALNRPGRLPGQYPAGGPLPHLIDVWRTGAPHLDMLSPDIYFFNFADWLYKYRDPARPLFLPETMRTARASANALFTIGEDDAIGFSPFDIELIPDPEHTLLSQTYGLLGQLTPEILAAQRDGKIRGLSPHANADSTMDFSPQTIQINGYTLHITFDGVGPTVPAMDAVGDPAMRGADLPTCGGLLYFTAPDEYTAIGTGVKITHSVPNGHVGLLDVSQWTNREGKWSFFRWLNGDETNQGRDIHLYPGDLKMQRVKLYRF